MRLLWNAKVGDYSAHPNFWGGGYNISPQDPTGRITLSGVLGAGGTVKLYFSFKPKPSFLASAYEVTELGSYNALGSAVVTNITKGFIIAAVTAGDGTTLLNVDFSFI